MWHELNTNTGDITVMWLAYDVNLVMSRWACASCVCVHGASAIIKMGTSKHSNGLTGAPANSIASHFKALIAQNANKNMPEMVPIVYLKENLRYCNEN